MKWESIKWAIQGNKNNACSVRHISTLLGIDATSEALTAIKDTCWEAVEAGEAECLTVNDTEQQFFRIA
jgi:hypothetical protein